MSSDISIQVEGLSKCYHIYDRPRDRLLQMLGRGKKQYFREFWALRDASFSVKRGETVGIIGRNGSGKSTLLQMICGTVAPSFGTVVTHGRVAALLELGAGFNIEFTGRENVMLNAAILGFPAQDMQARMAQVLEFSELGDFLDQPVKTYSSGMYARLAFSIAIHVDPDILIVDEALSVGDARFVAKCMRRIKEIKERGTTILFVSHDVGSIRTLCERVVWLDKGRLVEQGDVFPVTGRYMEFMFRDEQSEEEVLQAEIERQQQDLPQSSALPAIAGEEAVILLDARPVTHWGSHKGSILSASVLDVDGERKNVHYWNSAIEVRIDLHIPAGISREHLSVAFSIKDLQGSDLIVSTTHDFDGKVLPDTERFSVSFQLNNYLLTGKYLLVAALENRQHSDIHYYEYVEGAHYFSSLSDARLFGQFQPPIQHSILLK
ncbi:MULTISPECIES: ABC transporter ATP-binding protein [unclassified Janthinobacterium]|uniref:ABC transporter ATP-binding protein n=1 Tax=unclassified Janthinobacterium TaxID=2610881 RepID=UPI001613C95B|nr:MULTISPECIES: ABC transporter ATP-binding protein [unclassified Janthinobacterium]MBB5608032.1 lipopolysaccharide transport system ATP-binding protein [Janthinobacterium sp. S3T4]MBB5613227.1 lipopolysaccharide transport system ATP-binding protein [Janthinobacterium sp. S3M3]